MTEVQAGYLLIVNAVTFLVFGIDKKRAKKEQWRVPERTLLLFALAGGSVGALGRNVYIPAQNKKNQILGWDTGDFHIADFHIQIRGVGLSHPRSCIFPDKVVNTF